MLFEVMVKYTGCSVGVRKYLVEGVENDEEAAERVKRALYWEDDVDEVMYVREAHFSEGLYLVDVAD